MTPPRKTEFRTVALSDAAREELRALVLEMTTPAKRRITMSDVVLAAVAVARDHPDEVIKHLTDEGQP